MEEGTEISIDEGDSRRKFLGKAAAAGAGWVAGKWLGRHETSMVERGYFEHDGVRYYPMYEKHDEGPEVELPDGADGIFMEKVIRQFKLGGSERTVTEWDAYNIPADELVEGLRTYQKESYTQGVNVPAREALLEKVARLRIPIGIGDVSTSLEDSEQLHKSRTISDERKFVGGLLLLISSQLPDVMRSKLDARMAESMSRRSFFEDWRYFYCGSCCCWRCVWRLVSHRHQIL